MTANTLTASYTRPADTTQYTANDALAESTSAPTALSFGSAGFGWIVGARCVDSNNATTLPQLRLYIFYGSPTAVNDNAAFTLSDANLRACIAVLNFNVFVAGDDTSGTGGNAISMTAIDPVATTGPLYGLVKVLNAYTPISAEVFTFSLDIDVK